MVICYTAFKKASFLSGQKLLYCLLFKFMVNDLAMISKQRQPLQVEIVPLIK
jgi:hypothetical protein